MRGYLIEGGWCPTIFGVAGSRAARPNNRFQRTSLPPVKCLVTSSACRGGRAAAEPGRWAAWKRVNLEGRHLFDGKGKSLLARANSGSTPRAIVVSVYRSRSSRVIVGPQAPHPGARVPPVELVTEANLQAFGHRCAGATEGAGKNGCGSGELTSRGQSEASLGWGNERSKQESGLQSGGRGR